MNVKARALGHLENVNTFCDNLEQAMAQLGEKLFAFEYLQCNCKKEFFCQNKKVQIIQRLSCITKLNNFA